MKKCPKCDKTYDDTWKVCLNCVAKLDYIGATENELKLRQLEEERISSIDLAQLKKAYKDYNFCNITCSLIAFLISIPFLWLLISLLDRRTSETANSAVSKLVIIVFGLLCILLPYLWVMGKKANDVFKAMKRNDFCAPWFLVGMHRNLYFDEAKKIIKILEDKNTTQNKKQTK